MCTDCPPPSTRRSCLQECWPPAPILCHWCFLLSLGATTHTEPGAAGLQGGLLPKAGSCSSTSPSLLTRLSARSVACHLKVQSVCGNRPFLKPSSAHIAPPTCLQDCRAPSPAQRDRWRLRVPTLPGRSHPRSRHEAAAWQLQPPVLHACQCRQVSGSTEPVCSWPQSVTCSPSQSENQSTHPHAPAPVPDMCCAAATPDAAVHIRGVDATNGLMSSKASILQMWPCSGSSAFCRWVYTPGRGKCSLHGKELSGPSPCRGSSAFRRWWETTGGGGPRYQGASAVAEPLRHPVSGLPDRETILNRHAQHTSHCSACQAVSCRLLWRGSEIQSRSCVLLIAFQLCMCRYQKRMRILKRHAQHTAYNSAW